MKSQVIELAVVSWTEYATVGIAVAALVVSAVTGTWNRSTSRRALEISLRQESRLDPHLELYVINQQRLRTETDGTRVFGVQFRAANLSDRPTSLTVIDLQVTYDLNGASVTVKIPHISKHPTISLESFDLPSRIGPNDAISSWAVFEVQGDLVPPRQVQRYELVIADIHNHELRNQITVFHERDPWPAKNG